MCLKRTVWVGLEATRRPSHMAELQGLDLGPDLTKGETRLPSAMPTKD